MVVLSIATSELATTDLPERTHQPGPELHISKTFVLEENCRSRILSTLLFFKVAFSHYNEAEDTVICHSCMKMFKEKKNKTSTKADPAFVSSA